ncbi:mandelate racemase/muconate lactonizing enzyme family protein [Blastopirellula sp. JC732]|uniref:Mandelate racemase/muconate lactonizing enzyme family protein n=1 Tax=Blastopirellula sediminis TaxID=2894196 RepID=A0A9X1MSS0_9BACT|nr:mandelate racemase/muconate lactonizing enzyme family protein [Blastopirellula sediminis]MCC9604520.1 mandelate racemase/muconate lactonizing enzyme family protein [Blastopirellula sediminis]MCC9632181.1 mandelate racemase/muconate lactonizing enzyme family protein [Blastopirellula sediminis]
MAKPTDIRICDVQISAEHINYRTPIKFGGRVVNDVTLLNVALEVETADGRRGSGFGSMPMGNVWAWPTSITSGEATLQALVDIGTAIAEAAPKLDLSGHPLELTAAAHTQYADIAAKVASQAGITEAVPKLAALVAASPTEAAIHDAYGKALGQNSYNLLGAEYVNTDLATYLSSEFAGEYLDRYTLRKPQPKMPLYHLVGALDPLDLDELQNPVGDGLPETLGDWILADGLTHLKIKLNGDNLDWDAARVAKIDAVAIAAQAKRGVKVWQYSLDFNERCPNVQYILDFLAKLSESSPEALDRVQYIEQPTSRDLRANPENRMHAAAKIKPVVIDESLVDYESLLLAREQGYSGVALKACKGQSEALLMGAAAQKFGMFLCVQDLTCPGYSFLHSASLAARLPTIAAIEGNGRQYCPAGNVEWAKRFPSMFDITDGTVGTAVLDGPGLGF